MWCQKLRYKLPYLTSCKWGQCVFFCFGSGTKAKRQLVLACKVSVDLTKGQQLTQWKWEQVESSVLELKVDQKQLKCGLWNHVKFHFEVLQVGAHCASQSAAANMSDDIMPKYLKQLHFQLMGKNWKKGELSSEESGPELQTRAESSWKEMSRRLKRSWKRFK